MRKLYFTTCVIKKSEDCSRFDGYLFLIIFNPDDLMAKYEHSPNLKNENNLGK